MKKTAPATTDQPGASFDQDIPTAFNGFVYVISGSVRIGKDAALLKTNQAGWVDRPEGDGTSLLRMVADEEGVRLVLYAGQPEGDPIVSYGPFIGDSEQDIFRLSNEYRAGRFERMSEIARATR